MNRLQDRIVVITGTSRGLGKAIAESFAAEGATVIGASRSGGYDVTREEDVRRLVDGVISEHGRLDILVNNAGVLTPRKPLTEITREEWDTSITGNLTATFLCMREALRTMIPGKGGLIINVSSGVSNRAAPTWGPYAVAKWGVEGLSRLVAEENSEQGIRVVSINPGRTRTPMRAAAYPDENPETVKTAEETARFFLAVAAGDVPFESGDLLQYEEGR
jgi:NAD(P)-dependent dehydrogenase (short-subunit alcohol dehydrogenase family)